MTIDLRPEEFAVPSGSDAIPTRTPDGANLRVAYLINQYPKVSHTFIRREILALEKQGVTVLRFAIRGWDNEVADPIDHAERDKTRYLLQGGLGPLAAAVFKNFVQRPRAAWTALVAALSMSRNSVRSWVYHLIWFAHACRLRLWLDTENVSHLHAHFGTNSADVAYLLSLLGGPGFSFTVHGADECDNARRLSLPRKTAAARFVVTVSDYTRAQLFRVLPPNDWAKLKVVHCGLDEAFFADAPAVLPKEKTLLCIGRLCAEKGHLTLLDAFARAKLPNVKLVFAGDGEFRAVIEQRIRDLGLRGRADITGWISSNEVRNLITAATIVVQPSLMEGLPVVLMEALSQGRAVISTFVAGIPELVEAGRTGWLVPAGDEQKLTQAMETALATPDARLDEMGREGIEMVRAQHHIDTEVAHLRQLFAEETVA